MIDAKDTVISPTETNLHPSETLQHTVQDWIKTERLFHWNITVQTHTFRSSPVRHVTDWAWWADVCIHHPNTCLTETHRRFSESCHNSPAALKILSLIQCSQSKITSPLQTAFSLFLNMIFYHQFLDSSFVSTRFISINTIIIIFFLWEINK